MIATDELALKKNAAGVPDYLSTDVYFADLKYYLGQQQMVVPDGAL